MRLCQINLQPYFGGGEVYTAFLTQAFAKLGISTRLLVHPDAAYWPGMGLPPDTEIIPVAPGQSPEGLLGEDVCWVIGHGPLSPAVIERVKLLGGLATAIAHMPVQDRDPRRYARHDRVFAVSGWVLKGLRDAGLPVWPAPLYGVADLRGVSEVHDIRLGNCYDWDRRKARDKLLSWLAPIAVPFRSRTVYERKTQGITLGIVSRITPIKQFPLLFKFIAPVIARTKGINLEIFGSGGYASIRDLKRSLEPISERVRFWGHQTDVFSVYHGIDYLMSGLPEKEALGLNILEAQACGTPILAPAAPPFTETVIHGQTGFLYEDPRLDDGKAFEALLLNLLELPRPPDPRGATEHLLQFTLDGLAVRLRPIVTWAEGCLRT